MRILRGFLIGASALALTVSAAQAADLMIYDEPAAVVSPSGHDWSGLYVGVFGGYSAGTVDWTGEYFDGGGSLGSTSGSYDVDGWQLGGTIGANAQFDMFVLGVEGDLAWTSISGEGPAIDPLAADPSIPSSSIDWIGTVRGRAGVALDQVLLYGTAGLAVAGGEVGITNLDGAGDDRTAAMSAMGWTAGFGAEIALDENLSIKGEYLYTSLTMDENQFGNVLPADYLATNGTFAIHTFKVGLNYAF